MEFNIENDRSTDADVGWYGMLTTWHTMQEKYLVYSSPEWFCKSIQKCFVKISAKT